MMAFAAHATPRCRVPTSLVHFTAPLPALSAALAGDKPVRIVALGSSSTLGIGASGPKACYPSKLQSELRRRYPDKEIIVDNLGIGGQLATDMLPRIAKEVLPRRPALVIWQTGVNDAVRHVDIEVFRRTLAQGIDELQRSGVDVVLLDMQYFPRAEKMRDFARYLVVMRQTAASRKVPILQRYALMKHLVTSAQFTPQQLLASDLFHPSDLTYDCLGRVLADALQGEVGPINTAKSAPPRAKEAGAVAIVPVH